VGLVQAEHAAQHMAYGHDEIATDERGVFTFSNVTPGEDYFVHGKMQTLGEFGVLDTVRVPAPRDEQVVQAGSLSVAPGRRIAGQVVLSDGRPVPPGTRLLISLDPAFDAQVRTLDPDGRFEFRGVPRGDISIDLRLRGYRFAKESTGFTVAHGFPECSAAGDRDVEGMRLVLEPGEEYAVPVVGKGKP